MKAEISKEGKLAIIAESYTDEYALIAFLAAKDDASQARMQLYFSAGPVDYLIQELEMN